MTAALVIHAAITWALLGLIWTRTNWWRTIAWTVRGVCLVTLLIEHT